MKMFIYLISSLILYLKLLEHYDYYDRLQLSHMISGLSRAASAKAASSVILGGSQSPDSAPYLPADVV